MAKNLTTAQKKELAQVLYISTELTQKEIAAKVETTEKTMSKWVREGEWDKLRKSLLTTKSEQLRFLYDQVDALNKHINGREEKFANSKEADALLKLTAAIKNLETETSVGQVIEVATGFVRFVQRDDIQNAKLVTTLFDSYIKERLKNF